MARLQSIVSKAVISANRIIAFPVLLVMRAFSAIGITSAITKAAATAIRRDRLILASITLVSLELCFLFIVMILTSLGLSSAKTGMDVMIIAMRMVLIALAAASMIFFRYTKVDLKHRESAEKRSIARSRRNK